MTQTRKDRIEAEVAELSPRGTPQDTGLADVLHPGETPERFLLVEQNMGAASSEQSHYFSTHASLTDAEDYSDSQECPEDWWPLFALDLDTGQRFNAERTVSFIEVSN